HSILCMLRIRDSQHVPSELQDHVLATRTATDRRNPLLSSVADRSERAIQARIRTPRRDPQCVETGKIVDAVRRNPRRFAGGSRDAIGRMMRLELRIEISYNCDSHACRISTRLT